MKLIKYNKPKVNEAKEVPGMLNCQIEYEVKTAKGRLDYSGPKFTPEMWHQILSFFRWTNKEMQSESQVRLYVNLKLGRWAAWAFPQEARTGMSARELPVQEIVEQAKARFSFWSSDPSDDWLYFGTVHHHCSASAFQSSTDEQNEWNQDGLHITVGKMDQDIHDLHARLYLDGNCFDPDLSLFWPLDPILATQVPPSMHDELARFQMGEKVTVDFPDQWRANLIEGKPEHKRTERWDMEYYREQPLTFRIDDVMEEIQRECSGVSVSQDQWVEVLNEMCRNQICCIIVEACLRNNVSPEDVLEEVTQIPASF